MEHLYTKFDKEEEFDNILNDDVFINLKLDGMAFQVYWNSDTDEIEYHKRSGNSYKLGPKIDDFSRVFLKGYNTAIKHFEDNKELIDDYKFLTFEIVGEKIHLLSVETRDGKIIDDIETILEIAKKLKVEGPLTKFKGKLSDEQKTLIKDYFSNDEKATSKEFVQFTNKLLGTDLNEDEPIEGMVFSFKNYGEYKIVDPNYTDNIKNKKAKNEEIADKEKDDRENLIKLMCEWMSKNAQKMDDNYFKSLNMNFIEMIKDSKLYNKMMFYAVKLHNSMFEIQTERIPNEIASFLKSKGAAAKNIYELFLIVFKGIRKRNFHVSKEFDTENIHKIIDKIGGSVTEEYRYIEKIMNEQFTDLEF